ncbi:MAG: MarR family transcriptional regulator [Verrucomicrobiae bacterium]|nr:MarR family transcriptional regulator [Verrucomicrobiae bacterium]
MEKLPPVIRKFILHWGEMGTRWGINRTVAQIHALLFTSDRPLNAEEICEALGVARSNVSNSLKELQNWGIVRVVHLSGDRRDHFESMQDVWEMFRVIAAERKRREIDPTLSILRECLDDPEAGDSQGEIHARERMGDLLDFFELSTQFYEQMNRLPTKSAVKAFRMGDKLIKAVGLVPAGDSSATAKS